MTPGQSNAKLRAMCRVDTKLPDPVRIGEGWTAATDGYGIVALERTDVEVCPVAADMAAAIERLLVAPVAGPTVSISSVRDWCGVGPDPCVRCKGTGRQKCRECGGTRNSVHECSACGEDHRGPCPECEEDGRQSCGMCSAGTDKTGGTVFPGVEPFSRRRLGALLAGLPGDEVTLGILAAHVNKEGVLGVAGPGWRVVLMSMRVEPSGAPLLDALAAVRP